MPERTGEDGNGGDGASAEAAARAVSPAEAATPGTALPPQSGMGRIWERFRKAPGARLGLSLVIAFSLVALLAPFIAHRLPFVWKDGATGEVTWPLVREFFAPSDTTEPMLERSINFLFLFTPLAFVAWLLLGKYRPDLARRESRLISLLFGALVAAVLWLAIGGMVVDGGGKDWLHYEQAPVPEMDDIQNPAALSAAEGGVPPALHETVESIRVGGDQDDLRRAAIGPLQRAIEGPVISPEGLPAFDRLGLDPDNLSTALDRARWNRLAVEHIFPGLLAPMRQFRDTFLAMAAVSLLVLLGLTYICLAGAWQFALSPRWLALLVLAVVVAQLFRLPPKHDHTPYRRLYAEGAGWGVFPLIPYGPNEQGFGPKLPPAWYEVSPFYLPEDILSVERLLPKAPEEVLEKVSAAVHGAGGDAAEGDVGEGESKAEATLPQAAAARDVLAEALNEAIRGEEKDPARFGWGVDAGALAADRNARPYVDRLDSGRELSPVELLRFKRLAMDRALSGAVRPANAVRWKRPSSTPGYHALGTDESGRDVLVRIIHGARVSLSVGFVSVFLATVIGLVLGSLAAYYGGKVDMLISRFLEIMMCFPSFFLILAVIAVLDRRSIVNIMLVIGLTSWTGVARLVRGEMLRQKKMDYVKASIALGASDTRTIFRHILPNAMAPVLVSISFGITGAILTEAGLSFIGFGVTPPTPTWGQLLSETRDSPLANWWLVVFPGLVLFVSVLAYNFVGEAVRDALDPRTTL